jgi:hypothetical protein
MGPFPRRRFYRLLLPPVFRWRLDSPNVARLIQSQSQQPELLIFPQRDAVHDPCDHLSPCGKTMQPNCGSYLQRTTESCCASLGIHKVVRHDSENG